MHVRGGSFHGSMWAGKANPHAEQLPWDNGGRTANPAAAGGAPGEVGSVTWSVRGLPASTPIPRTLPHVSCQKGAVWGLPVDLCGGRSQVGPRERKSAFLGITSIPATVATVSVSP